MLVIAKPDQYSFFLFYSFCVGLQIRGSWVEISNPDYRKPIKSKF
jgi:hypothetical protein